MARRLLLLLGAGCLSGTLLAQQPVPRINRNIEGFERAVRKGRAADTEQVVKDLQEARVAAENLVAEGRKLKETMDRFVRRELEQPEFVKEIKSGTRQIRDLLRPLEDVAFLDPVDDGRPPKYQPASDYPGLTGQLAELERLCLASHGKIRAFYGYGVAVDQLQGPSLYDLTVSINRLSKAVAKSAEKLGS